jgi:hypothetical protein
MPYTAEDDALINSLRANSVGWDSVAVALGRPRNHGSTVRQYAIGRGFGRASSRPAALNVRGNPRDEAGADPLPAFHPISWGALVALPAWLGEVDG